MRRPHATTTVPDSAVIQLEPGSGTDLPTLLTAAGYHPHVYDRQQGLSGLLRGAQPDVVIVDSDRAPLKETFKTLKLLRLNPRTKTVPVIGCAREAELVAGRAARYRAQVYARRDQPDADTALLATIEQLTRGSPA